MPDLDEQIREFIDSGASPVTAAEVIAAHESMARGTVAGSRYRRPRRMKTYAMGAIAMATAICVLVVALIFGLGVSSPSKSKVVTPGRPAGVPASWQKVTFGGLTMYAPGNWPTVREQTWGNCRTSGDVPFRSSFVVLNAGAPEVGINCPLIGTNLATPVYGVLVDPGPEGILNGVSAFAKCLQINGLSVCSTAPSYAGIVILAVHIPGIARPVAAEIGLAGGGKVAHTILYSMRRSSPTSSTTASGTVRPCGHGVLAVAVGKPGDTATEMGGSVAVSVEVVNTGRSACSVTGTPRYFGRTALQTLVQLPHDVLTNGDGTVPRALPVVLTSTHNSIHNNGYVTFQLYISNSDQCLDPGTLMVELPGQTTAEVVPPGLQTCSVSTIFVRPVSSTDYLADLVGP